MKRLLRPALLLAGLVAVGLCARALPGGGAASWLQSRAQPDSGAAVAFVLASAGLCAVGVPRQVVAYSAGFTFGTLGGTALGLLAQVLGCALTFMWARLVARDWARGVMRRRLGGRLARLDRFLADSPFVSTLMLRLAPVGNNFVLNLVAGASGIPAAAFLLASAVGYLPQTIIFALLGGGTRVDQAAQIGIGIALFAGSALAGLVLLRRLRASGVSADA